MDLRDDLKTFSSEKPMMLEFGILWFNFELRETRFIFGVKIEFPFLSPLQSWQLIQSLPENYHLSHKQVTFEFSGHFEQFVHQSRLQWSESTEILQTQT